MTAKLEKRVDALEREGASLKERVGILDADMRALPDIIKAEFRLVDSRFARVLAELRDLQATVDERFQNFHAHVDQRFDAIAEMLKEMR